jgi:hypothetical protein
LLGRWWWVVGESWIWMLSLGYESLRASERAWVSVRMCGSVVIVNETAIETGISTSTVIAIVIVIVT